MEIFILPIFVMLVSIYLALRDILDEVKEFNKPSEPSVLRGTSYQKRNTRGYPGQCFHETDTDLDFWWNGSYWVQSPL